MAFQVVLNSDSQLAQRNIDSGDIIFSDLGPTQELVSLRLQPQ